MSTWKFARRSAAALVVVASTFAFVTAADKNESARSTSASAANSVVVESQTLMIGTAGSTVGVSLTNAVPIAGLLVPLEIRPVTPGTSIAETIVYQMNPSGRVANSPLGFADPSIDSLWPEATRVLHQTCVTCPTSCSGPVSNSYCVVDNSCTSPTTPYGMFFGTVSTGDPQVGELINLEAGADPGTSADASLQIILNQIGTLPGVFEIDTACWTPANSIAYALADAGLIIPSFTKGIIEIVCQCDCHADIICDGVTDLLDVVQTIDIIFRGESFVSQPFCPKSQVDVNCDGVTDIQDVVIVIEVAFRGGDASLLYCDPCAI
jgi:hypothetical protein